MSAFSIDANHTLLLDDVDDRLVLGKCLSMHSEGYVRLGNEYVHRLVVGAARGEIVDHIDGNRLNCKRKNLRKGTKSQNGWNRGKAKHNTSGFKGVSFCKCTGRYRAEIRFNRRAIKLGRFDTPQEAARAYDAAAYRYHGEFAHPNFPKHSGEA